MVGAGSTDKNVAGILLTLANHQIKTGTTLSKQALASPDPHLRNAALWPTPLGGSLAISDIIAHLAKSRHKEDLRGCEEALVILLKNPVSTAKTKEALIAMVPKVQAFPLSAALYYLLGQAGDHEVPPDPVRCGKDRRHAAL